VKGLSLIWLKSHMNLCGGVYGQDKKSGAFCVKELGSECTGTHAEKYFFAKDNARRKSVPAKLYLFKPGRTGKLAVFAEPSLPTHRLSEDEIQDLLSTSFDEKYWSVDVKARSEAMLSKQPLEVMRTVEKAKLEHAKKLQGEEEFGQAIDSSLVGMFNEFEDKASEVMGFSFMKTPSVKSSQGIRFGLSDVNEDDDDADSRVVAAIQKHHAERVQPQINVIKKSVGNQESIGLTGNLWSGLKSIQDKVAGLSVDTAFVQEIKTVVFSDKNFQKYMTSVDQSFKSIRRNVQEVQSKI